MKNKASSLETIDLNKNILLFVWIYNNDLYTDMSCDCVKLCIRRIFCFEDYLEYDFDRVDQNKN